MYHTDIFRDITNPHIEDDSQGERYHEIAF